jgi:hypothetical protein
MEIVEITESNKQSFFCVAGADSVENYAGTCGIKNLNSLRAQFAFAGCILFDELQKSSAM